jgi:hypothetical protein
MEYTSLLMGFEKRWRLESRILNHLLLSERGYRKIGCGFAIYKKKCEIVVSVLNIFE